MVSEFDLIRMIRGQADTLDNGVEVGIGDDAAVLQMPPDAELVVTTDTLNLGVHFHANTPPFELGHKTLAVNLSDLAAMGARPHWALLSISLPDADASWLEAFMQGFIGLAKQHQVKLVGGDTCAGTLSMTVTALGSVPRGQAMLRSSARPGDLVVVSGTLGTAGLALRQLESGHAPSPQVLSALHRPLPRVALGCALVGKATACIDISDGLMADLGHIAQASGCGARLETGSLPAAEALMALDAEDRWALQLASGDDYELCFTWPVRRAAELEALGKATGQPLTVIGRMVEGATLECRTPSGDRFDTARRGHEHFYDGNNNQRSTE